MLSLAALTGLLLGSAYGYVSRRGAFCMNSGFRAAVAERNTTKLKAFVLGIAVQMLIAPLLFASGLSAATYPALFPVGAVLGGLLFCVSMNWAGGCAAGVWYKSGAGSVGAMAAVLGMAADASKRFALGLGLGAGASLAAGCTVGHGLTGVPLLAPGSIVGIIAIFAGSAATSESRA